MYSFIFHYPVLSGVAGVFLFVVFLIFIGILISSREEEQNPMGAIVFDDNERCLEGPELTNLLLKD